MSQDDDSAATASDPLLGPELTETSYDEWRRRVEEELGDSFDSVLTRRTAEGGIRRPLYTARDLREADPAGFPGPAPHVRGARPLDRSWAVAQEVSSEADVRALGAAPGLDLVWVDPAAPGLETLLGRLDVARTAVVLGSGTGTAAPLLVAEAARQGVAPARLRGGFGCDPLGVLAGRGCLPGSLERAFELAAGLVAWSTRRAPEVRALLVDLAPYHDAGAGIAEELAFLAAGGVEVLRRLTVAPALPGGEVLDVDTVARQLIFALGVGGELFSEIAKLRAARRLWAKIVRASGGTEAASTIRLHARTSSVTRTVRDPWVNLLRSTSESFAAALGGADSIATAPYDELLGNAEPASRRLAVTTQHVLRDEAYLDRVLDPTGGSYYVETLTDELARSAWTLFQEIERRGGMARCLENGWVRERVADTAEKRRRDAARRRTLIVGTSEFPHLDETLPERSSAAAAQGRPAQPRPRGSDVAARLADLAELAAAAPAAGAELFDTALMAIEAGATLGELAATLWRGTEPVSIERLEPVRPAEPFEELRRRGNRWRDAHGRRARVFLARIGEPEDFRARTAFAASFFAVGGIEATDRGGISVEDGLAGRVADEFAESGAELAVLCSSDELYPEVAAGAAAALKARGARAVALAGRPGEGEGAYREAGVDAFIFLGCDAVAVLEDLWRAVEQ